MADLRQSMLQEGAAFTGESSATGLAGTSQHSNLLEFPPAFRGRVSASALAILQKTVEADVLPRLALAHPGSIRNDRRLATTPSRPQHDQVRDEVREFCDLVLSKNPDAAMGHVEKLRQQGHSLEAIYMQWLAPCARYLRHLWDEDVCDFADATLALWRLQQILRDFSAAFRSSGSQNSCGLRALLAPAPGETHALGYLMFDLALIAEFFRRDGWDAWVEPNSSGVEFSSLVRSQWFDVVEFIVSGDKRLDALAAAISAVRRDSPNQALRVLVCGPAFVQHPELVLVVGGDVPAADPRRGVAQARNLVGPPASRG